MADDEFAWLPVFSGLLVSVAGVLLVWIVIEHLLAEHPKLLTIILGGGLPLMMGLVTIVGGTWIARSDLSTSGLAIMLGWWVFGMVITGLMGGMAILYEQSHGVALVDAQYLITNNMTAGSAGGLLVGHLYTKVRHRATELDTERGKLTTERERLEILNRVVRHDIRNDMAVVLGWLQTLDNHVDSDREEALERVKSASNHVVELTELAREYVEVIVGETDPELTDVAVSAVLRNEVRTQQETHPDAEFSIDGDLPQGTVKANQMLSSVFRNILNNAVRHNDAETPAVSVSVEETNEHLLVQIADNGPGIPDDQKETVFGKGSHDLDSPGTGIGLYLIRSLVDEFGGEVWIEDNEPTGAIFNVSLRKSGASS